MCRNSVNKFLTSFVHSVQLILKSTKVKINITDKAKVQTFSIMDIVLDVVASLRFNPI